MLCLQNLAFKICSYKVHNESKEFFILFFNITENPNNVLKVEFLQKEKHSRACDFNRIVPYNFFHLPEARQLVAPKPD